MSNAEQDINAFCSALLGGPDGTGDDRLIGYYLCVWTLPDRVARWIPAEVPGSIASVVLELANRQPSAVHAVYIGMGFVPTEIVERKAREEQQDGKKRRAEARDIAGIPGLWADIDIAGHGHAKDGLPPNLDAALAIVDSLGIEPTLIIHTGRGIQVWWAFTEPALFENDAERADIADLAKSWNMTIKVRAGEYAAGVDSVFDLSRLMRAVGSTNTKGADGKHGGPVEGHRPVTIIRNTGFTWNPEDFREFLAGPDAIAAVSAVVPVSGHDAATLDGVDLNAVWRRATSVASKERGYIPATVAAMIDVDDTTKLADTWNRKRPEFKDDQSTYDAALIRLLHDAGVPVAEQVEALMCHRLAAGGDTDKVNPSKRTDYIARTVLNVHAMAEKAATERAEAKAERDAITEGIAAHRDKPVELNTPTAVPDTPEPDPIVDTVPDIPADKTGPETALTLVREPEPRDTPVDTEPVDVATWGQRHPDTVSILGLLDKLLIPQKYRDEGIRTWGMERRDHGENQKGRLIFEIPTGYSWPGGGPDIYTPGNPLKAEWYPKPMFEGPKGFRASLERDAMIPALPVGKNKEEWAAIATELVGHWQPDSTGADLATTAKNWLLDYLITHPATTSDVVGVTEKRAYLVSTGGWGTLGTPKIVILFSAFGEYVSAQPGGRQYAGRAAKDLISYMRLRDKRMIMAGADGKPKKRSGWWEIDPTQFSTEEWGQVLEVAHEQMMSSEERRLRSIPGGAS